VHINAGIAALATALFLGRRRGYPEHVSPPHNLPLAVLGAGILWFGWFGFNAGSALAAGGLAAGAFVATHTAAAAAGLTWSLLEWKLNERPTMLGMITGAVAGLVAVTPAAGFVNIFGAIGIGVGVSCIGYVAVTIIKVKFGYDDSLDAFNVHGMGGIWGAIATGLWATKAANPRGADGFFYGNAGQLLIQLKAVGVTIAYSFLMTWILLAAVNALLGLRVDEQDERIGLDLTQHRESGYTLLD
jgi:Amt family ammonium transporter